MFEAIACGICKVTDHKVMYVVDNEFAEQCPLYENKYGYEEHEDVIMYHYNKLGKMGYKAEENFENSPNDRNIQSTIIKVRRGIKRF